MYINVFKGVIASYIFTFVSFLVFAILLSTTNISDSYISGVISVISVISILIGSAFVLKKLVLKDLFGEVLLALFTRLFFIL